MLLTDYIPEHCIAPSLEARTKTKALAELTDLLVQAGEVDEADRLIEELMVRESTESTGIGRGVAIPHARVRTLGRLVCALGRSKKGIEFKAIDRQPVHLIFLIFYPPAQQTTYLNFLATLTRLLRDEGEMRRVLEAESGADLFQIMERLSRSLEKPEEDVRKQVESGTAPAEQGPERVDLVLLARLELCNEMLEASQTDRDEIQRRIGNIRGLLDPRHLQHFDQLKRRGGSALAAVEGEICQGCFRQLPSHLVQILRRESDRVHTCSHCARFLYLV